MKGMVLMMVLAVIFGCGGRQSGKVTRSDH